MTTSTCYAISNGPSKWDLSVALFDRKTGNSRKAVFEVDFEKHPLTPITYEVQVNSVQAEDGSGESWNIEGYATPQSDARGGDLARATHNPSLPELQVRSHRVAIYFRTDRRKGTIRFFD